MFQSTPIASVMAPGRKVRRLYHNSNTRKRLALLIAWTSDRRTEQHRGIIKNYVIRLLAGVSWASGRHSRSRYWLAGPRALLGPPTMLASSDVALFAVLDAAGKRADYLTVGPGLEEVQVRAVALTSGRSAAIFGAA